MKVLVLASTFPRWKNDVRPPFVFYLSRSMYDLGEYIVALTPHCAGAMKKENLDGVVVKRFVYIYPYEMQKLAYGPGVLPNFKRSTFAKLLVPSFCLSEFINALVTIRNERINIINAHWIYPQGLIGVMCKKVLRKPVVIIIQGTDLNLVKKWQWLAVLTKYLFHNADRIIVNSSFLKKSVISLDKTLEDRISIVHMGVDDELFKPHSVSWVKEKYSMEQMIFTNCRLIDWKGIDDLIMAMPKVIERYPGAKLIISGDGPEKVRLQNIAKALDISDKVIFLGEMSNIKLPDYYSSADVFVLPSINKEGLTEGLGIVLIEAMAAGTPVIGTDVGGIPDIIQDGYNGFLVPERSPELIANKIIEIIDDPRLAETFRNNGLNVVRQKFLWSNIAEQFNEINKTIYDAYSKNK